MKLNEIKHLLSEDTYDTTITIRGRKLNVSVEFTSSGASRGYRDSLGVPEEPDEDADIEIDGVYVMRDGKKKDITKFIDDATMETLHNEIMQNAEPDYDYDGPEPDDYDDGRF